MVDKKYPKKTQDWLNGLEIDISERFMNYQITLTGYSQIFKFFQSEVDFWANLMPSKAAGLQAYAQHSALIVQKLEPLPTTALEGLNSAKNEWKTITELINQDGLNANGQHHYIFSNTEEAQLIARLQKKNHAWAEGAAVFYDNKDLSSTNYQSIQGYMLALELANSKDGFGKPTDHRRATYEKIRSEIETYRNDLADALEYFTLASKTSLSDADENLKSLAKTYDDQMALKGPSRFWKLRAAKYKTRGQNWLGGLIATTLVVVAAFIAILYNPPELLFSSTSATDLFFTPRNIKGVFILATVISLLVYVIRIQARMLFSSFHLERDAEERRQLTMVYLALIRNNAAFPKEDREIILNSLFSRAEIGILGDDHGPTMPHTAVFEAAVRKK